MQHQCYILPPQEQRKSAKITLTVDHLTKDQQRSSIRKMKIKPKFIVVRRNEKLSHNGAGRSLNLFSGD